MVFSSQNELVNHAVAMVRVSLAHPQSPARLSRPSASMFCLLPSPFPCCSQCVDGLSARDAWLACDKPNGEKGIQNIRKRARLLLEARAKAPAATPAPTPAANVATTPASGSAGKAKAPFRLRHDQVAKQVAHDAEIRAEFERLYKDATREWADLFAAGKTGKGAFSSDAIAEKYAVQLPAGCKRGITGRMLREALNTGRAGEAPRKRGPQPVLPAAFVASVADFAQLQQIAGNDQKPRQLVASAVASTLGTVYEGALCLQSQRASLCRRVRREMGLVIATSTTIDDRRWLWLTSTNVTKWMAGYKSILFDLKYIDSIPDDIFAVIVIDPRKLSRMSNGDESHQKLSGEGEKTGPRSHVYTNPALGRAGKRKVEHQKHATILAWVNYAGEAGSPHMMLATSAEAAKKKGASADADEANIRTQVEWMFGIPRVIGKFGFDEIKTFEPTFVMNENGGMQSGGLEQFVRLNLLECYPNVTKDWVFNEDGALVSGPLFMQLDAGPDRYTETSLGFRAEMWEKGVVFFPGLPNGTASTQVMDDLFGPYKKGNQENIEDIISERIVANLEDPEVKVIINFCDLGRVINGRHEDPISKRPFSNSFTTPKILASTARLGLSPISLKKALDHPRVRDDSSEGATIDAVRAVVEEAPKRLEIVSALGFNASALSVPVRVEPPASLNVAPPSDLEAQWKALKAAGSSAGAHWHAVGAKAFNAPEVLGPALERVQEKQAAERQQLQKKAAGFTSLLESARAIFEELEEDQLEYCELAGGPLKTLVSFIHQARGESGASKHTTNKASCLAFLESISVEALGELIAAPPSEKAVRLLESVVVEAVAEEVTPLLALAAPGTLTLDIELPPGLSIQSPAPDWVEAALAQGSDTASKLVGYSLVYRWPVRLGGWLVGKITGVNTDSSMKASGSVCNFIAFYESDQDSAHHHLSIGAYAKSAKAKVDSWALLA